MVALLMEAAFVVPKSQLMSSKHWGLQLGPNFASWLSPLTSCAPPGFVNCRNASIAIVHLPQMFERSVPSPSGHTGDHLRVSLYCASSFFTTASTTDLTCESSSFPDPLSLSPSLSPAFE